jgi:hypothetical protein
MLDKAAKDHAILQKIMTILDADEWRPETLKEIAILLYSNGYRIEQTEENKRPVARFDPWRCSKCSYVMDAATEAFGDGLPEEGDVALCMSCGEPHTLHQNRWIGITDDELIDMSAEQKAKMSKAQIAIRELNNQRSK